MAIGIRQLFKIMKQSNNIKKPFNSFLSFLLLILLCTAASFIVVLPLWKLSTAAPKLYTAAILILSLAAILYFLIKKIIKTPAKTTIRVILNTILVCTAVSLFFVLVINQKRLLAFISLAGITVIIIILNLIFNKTGKKKS